MKKENLKRNASKSFRVSINKAVQALREMKSQTGQSYIVSVQPNVVVVRVKDVPKAEILARSGRYYVRPGAAVNVKAGTFVDQSIVDIQRAVNTLEREPSRKVKEVYSQMAEIVSS